MTLIETLKLSIVEATTETHIVFSLGLHTPIDPNLFRDFLYTKVVGPDHFMVKMNIHIFKTAHHINVQCSPVYEFVSFSRSQSPSTWSYWCYRWFCSSPQCPWWLAHPPQTHSHQWLSHHGLWDMITDANCWCWSQFSNLGLNSVVLEDEDQGPSG